MNTYNLRYNIRSIGSYLIELIKSKNTDHNIFKYFIFNLLNIEQDREHLYLKLFGGEFECCCYHFNSTFEEGDCGYKGKKFVKDYTNGCTYPFYKAVCNKNTIMEPFLVEAIKNYKFDVKIPTNIDMNYNKDTHQFEDFNQKYTYESPNGEKLIQFFEENTFGGLLKDKIINFIEEVRRSHPRIN